MGLLTDLIAPWLRPPPEQTILGPIAPPANVPVRTSRSSLGGMPLEVAVRETYMYPPEILINDRPVPKAVLTGARGKYVDTELGVIVKIDGHGLAQAKWETVVWFDLLEEADRRHFVPIVAYGRNWVMQPVTTFGKTYVHSFDDVVEQAKDLFDLYGIGDFSSEQFKPSECGELLIHDYGVERYKHWS